MTKNESWDVHLLVLVLHHRYTFTVVPDRNGVGLTDGENKKKGRRGYRGYMNRVWTHNLKYTPVCDRSRNSGCWEDVLFRHKHGRMHPVQTGGRIDRATLEQRSVSATLWDSK